MTPDPELYQFGVHLPTGLPTIDAGGEARVLACRFADPSVRMAYSKALAAGDVLPRSEWVEIDLEEQGWVPATYDQDGHGSCVGHGAATAFGMAWYLAGHARHRFSACYTYSLINGGRDQGAIVSDALEAMQRKGVCLETTVGPGKIYRSHYDAARADEEAARFKPDQWARLDTFDEIMTAIMLGLGGVCFGAMLGRAFEPDSRGVIPDRRGSGGGHCMAVTGAKKIDGRWYAKIKNSWHDRWGVAGSAYMPESYFDYPDAWLVTAPKADPQDTTKPPAPAVLVQADGSEWDADAAGSGSGSGRGR